MADSSASRLLSQALRARLVVSSWPCSVLAPKEFDRRSIAPVRMHARMRSSWDHPVSWLGPGRCREMNHRRVGSGPAGLLCSIRRASLPRQGPERLSNTATQQVSWWYRGIQQDRRHSVLGWLPLRRTHLDEVVEDGSRPKLTSPLPLSRSERLLLFFATLRSLLTMSEASGEIDLDSVIDRLLEGASLDVNQACRVHVLPWLECDLAGLLVGVR